MSKNSGKKVRSTLFLSEERREKIRSTGLSLEEYINRLIEKQEHFSMDKWRDGAFWINQYRVGIFMAETINYCFTQFEDRKLYEAGLEMGRTARVSLQYDNEVNGGTNAEILDDLNSFFGWGQFSIEEKRITIKQPLFNDPYFIYGFLESLLKVKLNMIESVSNRIVFEIQRESSISQQSEIAIIDLLYTYQLELDKARSIEDVSKSTLIAISKAISYSQIGFGVIEGNSFRFISKLPKNAVIPADWSPSLDEKGVTLRTIKVGRSLFSKRGEQDKKLVSNDQPIIKTELIVPIKINGKIVAFIHAQSNRLNPFRYREHRILETISMYITSTLYRIEGEKALNLKVDNNH